MTNTAVKPRIDMGQFLTLSVNTLHRYFFQAPREKSRRLFKEIAAGDAVGVATLTVGEDKAQAIKLKLSLDRSEYKGHLTFHLFQRALDLMLRNIADRLQRKEDLNIFTSEQTGEILIHLPGLVEDRGNLNVLVMGIAPSKTGALIKLLFLDSDQFRKDNPDAQGEVVDGTAAEG
ncbi:MAG: hypothetical protein WC247_08460 [Porticoccaceae bacterium]